MTKFLQGIALDLYERVIVSWKPTLIGILLAAGVEAVNYTTTYLNGVPKPWAHSAAALLAIVGMAIKTSSVKVTP